MSTARTVTVHEPPDPLAEELRLREALERGEQKIDRLVAAGRTQEARQVTEVWCELLRRYERHVDEHGLWARPLTATPAGGE